MSEKERKAREKAVDEQGLFEKYGLKPGDHVRIIPKIGHKKSVFDGLTGRIHSLTKNGVGVEFDEEQSDASSQWFDFGSIMKIPG